MKNNYSVIFVRFYRLLLHYQFLCYVSIQILLRPLFKIYVITGR